MRSRPRMLTLADIRKAIANDPRFDQEIDLEEKGKAILYLLDGWTWSLADGNRHVEGFVFSDDCIDERDTLAYFKERLRMITEEQ